MERIKFYFPSISTKRFGALQELRLYYKDKKNSTGSSRDGRTLLESSLARSPKRVCISCFISALRPITSFVRWHLHVNGKSGRAGIRRPRAGINQKGNLKKGLQPAQCVTTPKGCRTANPQECHYLKEKIVSLTRIAAFFLFLR